MKIRDHPIAAVMIGDAKKASELADAMLQKGIYVIGFSFPVRCDNTNTWSFYIYAL